ncbi:MAG TPA: 50S ribosomal protein L24 [Clostridiales bacterium]|nr:50S ribosomal protein L24 [Clostridiales bacterium]
MANKVHVKTGDMVYVLSGKGRGKKGKVLKVLPKEKRVVVQGVNIVKKHQKPRSMYQQGGIVEKEGTISSSNVMLICPRCNKPTKIGKDVMENGQKARVCKKCSEVIDVIKEAKDDK